jgi:hypothetical protein
MRPLQTRSSKAGYLVGGTANPLSRSILVIPSAVSTVYAAGFGRLKIMELWKATGTGDLASPSAPFTESRGREVLRTSMRVKAT